MPKIAKIEYLLLKAIQISLGCMLLKRPNVTAQAQFPHNFRDIAQSP